MIQRATVTEVTAAEFKAHCLELIQRVNQTHEEIVVTRYGRPLAKLVAYAEEVPPLLGYMAAFTGDVGDLLAPIDEEWESDAG